MGPRHRTTVGSYGGGVSYERGTPLQASLYFVDTNTALSFFSTQLVCTTSRVGTGVPRSQDPSPP